MGVYLIGISEPRSFPSTIFFGLFAELSPYSLIFYFSLLTMPKILFKFFKKWWLLDPSVYFYKSSSMLSITSLSMQISWSWFLNKLFLNNYFKGDLLCSWAIDVLLSTLLIIGWVRTLLEKEKSWKLSLSISDNSQLDSSAIFSRLTFNGLL